MQYSLIPATDLRVSRICLGTMTFGSPVAEPDAIRLIHYALEERGINFIDTANMYEGYNRVAGSAGGVAEEIIGKALAGRRDRYVVATKVGMKPLDGETLIDPAWFRPDLVVADTVYNPRETRMIREAQAAGCKAAIGGIGMLLWQGVAAFQLFTGKEMPAQEVLEKFFS